MIIENAFVSYNWVIFLASILLVSAAFFTAYYSFKSLFLTFFSKSRASRTYFNFAHEPSFFMLAPIIILSIFSIGFGECAQDAFLSANFWQNSLNEFSTKSTYMLAEYIHFSLKNVAFIVSVLGIIFSYFLFSFINADFIIFNRSIYSIFVKKLWFDNLYNRLLIKFLVDLSYLGTFQSIDKGLLEVFGPKGLSGFVNALSLAIKPIQSGYIYNYLLLSFFGYIAFCLVIYLL